MPKRPKVRTAKAGKIRPQRPIELYYWPTSNGYKVGIMLEECGLPYVPKVININRDEQYAPAFLSISPNNRIPAIVDHNGPGGRRISVFESGAILQYLGRKTGRFYPKDERKRIAVEEWLFWQVGGLGPMAGQASHFVEVMNDPDDYGQKRYVSELIRLLGVMNRRLKRRTYLADVYSIADMACYGWTLSASRMVGLEEFPNVRTWMDRVGNRPAVRRTYALGKQIRAEQAAKAKKAK